MIVDIYTHILPHAFTDRMAEVAPNLGDISNRMKAVTLVHNLDERFRELDKYGDYRQIVSLPNPPIEDIATPEQGAELARVGNDAMAELVQKHGDRFPGFVAALCMTDMDATMVELHRAIRDLGASGVQIFTNVKGEPLDQDKYKPLFEAMAEYDLPIWLHPARTAMMPDYPAEPRSRYEMWWCFGWPYETSVAMARLVFWGLFDRHPDIKIITHHCGGMIPYFDGRVGPGLDVLGSRTSGEDYSEVLSSLKKPHLDYFKMFYADTAMFGSEIGVKCGLDFFGRDQVVFASDSPFAPIGASIQAMDRLGLDRPALDQLCLQNAEKVLNTKLG